MTSTASHLCHALRLFGSSSGSSWTWYASAVLPSAASSESLGSACACARFSTSASSSVIVSELSADMGGEWYRGTTGQREMRGGESVISHWGRREHGEGGSPAVIREARVAQSRAIASAAEPSERDSRRRSRSAVSIGVVARSSNGHPLLFAFKVCSQLGIALLAHSYVCQLKPSNTSRRKWPCQPTYARSEAEPMASPRRYVGHSNARRCSPVSIIIARSRASYASNHFHLSCILYHSCRVTP